MKHQKPNPKNKNYFYHSARCIIRPMLDVLSHLESHGNRHIPKQGDVVLPSNHVSFLDPIIIGASTVRELHFLGTDAYFHIPCLGWFLTNVNSFPIKRGTPDRRALKEALSRLKTGKALLVFPEGTRSPDGTLGKTKNGVSFMIHHSNVPTIPVFLNGAERFLPRGSKFIRPTQLSVTFGAPLDFTTLRGIHTKREMYRRMNEQIHQAILALASDSC